MAWRKKLAYLLLTSSLLFTASCGTLLYPERSGQGAGRIDPAVAILNGVGVLFYVIPGLVAFAIDFSNGTIYLPGGRKSSMGLDNPYELAVDGPMTKQSISAIIEKELAVADVFDDPRLVVVDRH